MNFYNDSAESHANSMTQKSDVFEFLRPLKEKVSGRTLTQTVWFLRLLCVWFGRKKNKGKIFSRGKVCVLKA